MALTGALSFLVLTMGPSHTAHVDAALSAKLQPPPGTVIGTAWRPAPGRRSEAAWDLRAALKPFDGLPKFRSGDDPAWSSPSYNDSEWAERDAAAGWPSLAIPLRGERIGWYRLRFDSDPILPGVDPAVYLGRVGQSDEVFLNGVKIGGEGELGQGFVQASWTERVYPLPRELLYSDRPNILAVRVMNVYGSGGLLDSDIGVGDFRSLRLVKAERESARKQFEGVFLTLTVLLLLLISLLQSRNPQHLDYLYCAILLLAYGGAFAMDSQLAYDAGLKTHGIQKLVFILWFLTVGAGGILAVRVFQAPLKTMARITAGGCVLLSLVAWFRLDRYSGEILMLSLPLYLLAAVVSLAASVRGIFLRYAGAWAVLTGLAVLFTAIGIEWWGAFGYSSILSRVPAYPTDFGVAVMMICIMYTMVARFRTARATIQSLSARVMEAHEEQNRKLALELHDELGQGLTALNLDLSWLERHLAQGEAPQQKKVKGMTAVVQDLIRAGRRISTQLRPRTLDDLGLIATLEWYVRDFQERTGVQCNLRTPIEDLPLDSHTSTAIFRITQEALTNVIRHSGATAVDIRLDATNRRLTLEIVDNGQGFKESGRSGSTSLGILGMRERAVALGGECEVEGKPGHGTRVWVRVPLQNS
ncbi:MAG: sensor histidine kinase [Nitrospirae bacterium]|nr:sensor histidine kinase [Nitrospirota bacterium]